MYKPSLFLFFLLHLLTTTTTTTTSNTTQTLRSHTTLQSVPDDHGDHHHHHHHHDPHNNEILTQMKERTEIQEQDEAQNQGQAVHKQEEGGQAQEQGLPEGQVYEAQETRAADNDTYISPAMRRHHEIWMERIMQSEYVKNRTSGGVDHRRNRTTEGQGSVANHVEKNQGESGGERGRLEDIVEVYDKVNGIERENEIENEGKMGRKDEDGNEEKENVETENEEGREERIQMREMDDEMEGIEEEEEENEIEDGEENETEDEEGDEEEEEEENMNEVDGEEINEEDNNDNEMEEEKETSKQNGRERNKDKKKKKREEEEEKKKKRKKKRSRAVGKIIHRGINKKKKTGMPKPYSVDYSCRCGQHNTRTSRIVGGDETKEHAYPWMVSMQLTKGRTHVCGCSIITPHYVLTAAHCTEGLFPFELVVHVGDHNLAVKDTSREKTIKVAGIIEHPRYDVETTNNDIALLKLAESLAFTWRVAPICLTPPDLTFYRESVRVMGWGRRFEKDKQKATILRYVDVKVLPMNKCRYNFQLESDEVTGKMLCAHGGSRDTCQGDSGGPLVWYDASTDRYFLVGVTSWGVGCGLKQYPGVYTKVSKFLPWIYEETKKSSYCASYVPKPDTKKIRVHRKTKGKQESGVVSRMIRENGEWIRKQKKKNGVTRRHGKALTDEEKNKGKDGKRKTSKKRNRRRKKKNERKIPGKKTKKGLVLGGKKKHRKSGGKGKIMKKKGNKERKKTRKVKRGRKIRKGRKGKMRNGLTKRRKNKKQKKVEEDQQEDKKEREKKIE